MVSVKACRICLATDVKMNLIQGALEGNFKAVFGHNIVYSRDLPHYICYECSSMIIKYNIFRKKYFTAQSVLYNILQNCGEVTEKEINCLDRKQLNLQSRLSHFNVFSHHWPQIEEIKIEENIDDIALDMMVDEDTKTGIDEDSDCPEDDLPLIFTVKQGQKDKRKKNSFNSTKKKTMKVTKYPIEVQSVKITDSKETRTMKQEYDMLKGFEVTKLSLEEQLAEVEKRQDSSNYKDSPFKCDVCFKGFLQAETLNNHTVQHDASSGDIECEVCKFRFNTRRSYSLHVVRHAKKYACKECDFVTVHSDQAKKHKQWHDGVTYKCQYCNEISTKLTSHLSHMRIKHTSDFVCEMCGYSYVSLKGLKMHKSRMHKDLMKDQSVTEKCEVDNTDKSNLYCKECKLQFVTREAWKRHTVTSAKHRDDLGNGCRHCGESFPSAASLRRHTRTHTHALAHAHAHTRAARRLLARKRYVPRDRRRTGLCNPSLVRYPATCEHCDEVILNRSRHWKHYQRCHQDKKYPLSENNYICEICGKGFQANAFLVYHKRTHFEERAYKCPNCPKAFHNRANLHVHIKTHSQCRPHACTVCCKTFKTKLGLQQHFKSHTGVRPFPCQYCGKSFTRTACRALHVTHMHMRRLANSDTIQRD